MNVSKDISLYRKIFDKIFNPCFKIHMKKVKEQFWIASMCIGFSISVDMLDFWRTRYG